MCAHMSRPASLASRQVHAGYVLGCSRRCGQPGTLPIGTYIAEISKSRQEFSIDTLHPVGLFCKDIDDELLVLHFPPPVSWMRVNDGLDIVFNVPLLFALVMQGNAVGN